ncbi:hypothetical protein GCM10023320_44890 [Pseudonocardia adelaidensis]|uniref:Uncharacterized protein n=1 Tax=Pseudonocardia adelaidensis TaxID=648754 RepID=A0ABP9NQY6_9PSEU
MGKPSASGTRQSPDGRVVSGTMWAATTAHRGAGRPSRTADDVTMPRASLRPVAPTSRARGIPAPPQGERSGG